MITFRKLQDTIVGTIDGKPFNMARTVENVEFLTNANTDNTPSKEVFEYIKASRSNEIALSNKYLIFRPATDEYFLAFEGYRSKQPIPEVLRVLIENSYDKDMDFMPIIKAWARLLANPRYTQQMADYFAAYMSTTFTDQEEVSRLMNDEEYTRDAAVALASYQDIAITQEGLLATYKVAEIVTWEYMMELQEDGTYLKKKKDALGRIPAVLDPITGEVLEEEKFDRPDTKEEFIFTPAICKSGHKFYSGDKLGYIYQIGKMQYLPTEAPRNLNNSFGGGGLYIGGLNYIDNYRSSGTHVLTCFASPTDILSFQSSGQAIRVDALMPNNVWDEDAMVGIYHSSDYGKMSDARVDSLIKAATEKGISIIEDQTNSPDE
jgi:hypothetical protein